MWKILKDSYLFKDLIHSEIIALIMIVIIYAINQRNPIFMILSTMGTTLIFTALLYEVEKICQKGEGEEESQQ